MTETLPQARPWIWKAAVFLFPALLGLSIVVAVTLKVTGGAPNAMTQQEYAKTSFDEDSLRDAMNKLTRFMFQRGFSQGIPQEQLQMTSAFLRGTIGPQNLGYQIAEGEGFAEGGRIWKSYWVHSRSGRERDAVTIEVLYPEESESLAALLAVAEWMRGRDFQKKVRLGFLVKEKDATQSGGVVVRLEDLGKGGQGIEITPEDVKVSPIRFSLSSKTKHPSQTVAWDEPQAWSNFVLQVSALCEKIAELAGEQAS